MNSIKLPPILRVLFAEYLATFFLIFFGCGAILVSKTTGAFDHAWIAMAFGLVVIAMIAATGHVSGAHFNAAVTIAFAIFRKFPWQRVPGYLLAQFLGAWTAALALRSLFGLIANLGATLPSGPLMQSFWLEIAMTGGLMFLVMALTTDAKIESGQAAMIVGGYIALSALWGGPISGASLNPMRSFGPALAAGLWQDQWIYWVAPVLGAILGGLLYQLIRPESGE